MIYQIEKHIADLLKDFFKNYEFIDKVVVFGSRAKHNANPKSDIDLCAYSLKMSDKEFSKLRLEIDDLPILQKLDVVHFEKVNAELQNNIEKDGKLLYKKVKKVKLIDVCSFQGGSQPPKNEWIEKEQDGFVRMLQIRDFTQGHDKYIQYVKDNSRLKKCQSNDILIGRYGASIGKILTGLTGAYNVALMKVTPNKLLNREYLYHYLKSDIFQNIILSIGSRAAQAGFNKEDLSTIEINLPSLEKQKQIAKILDKANELINLRKESITKLDALAKSIFIDMFGDPVSNPKGWEEFKLGSLMKIRRGASPRPIANFIGEDIPWIKIGDGTKGSNLYIENTKVKIISEGKNKSVYLKRGSLIFANCGVSLGFCRILKIDGCIHDGWLSFEDIDAKLNDIFVLKLINNSTKRLQDSASGGTQPNLNIDIMKNFIIYLPPINLQNKFAKIIEKIEEQKSLYEKELELLQNNFDALLQKSFQE